MTPIDSPHHAFGQFPSFLAVEGLVATGKTALVQRLAELSEHVNPVLDGCEPNPFLENFYQDRERYAFQTETFFLLNRFQQQDELRQGDLFRRITISDYFFDRTRLYASLTLNDQELAMFDRVYSALLPQVVRPDFVIYLEPSSKDLEMIAKKSSHPLSAEYVAGLSRMYHDYFQHYDASPVVTVRLEDSDLSDDSEIEKLVARISEEWLRHTARISSHRGFGHAFFGRSLRG